MSVLCRFMVLPRVFAWGLVCALGLPAQATADPNPDPKKDQILVLGVRGLGAGRIPERLLGETVIERLLRMGEPVVKEVASGRPGCEEDPGCVSNLARTKGASRVIDGQVSTLGTEGNYRVVMRLFDARERRDLRKEEGTCSECDHETLAETAANLTSALFELQLSHDRPPKRRALAGQAGGRYSPYWTTGRGLALGASATLFLGGLVSTLVLQLTVDGKVLKDQDGSMYRYQLAPVYVGTTSTATALGGLGVALAFALPTSLGRTEGSR